MDTKRYSILFIKILFFITVLIFLIYIFFLSEQNVPCDSYDSYITNKKNIAIITIENRESLKDLIDIHNKSVNNYSIINGYEYYFISDYKSQDNLPVYWWKIQYMKDMLDTNKWEYILWLDSDVIITKPEIPLESLIDTQEKKTGVNASIFIGRDHPSKKNNSFCAGVFMIKNDKIGKNFIDECLDTYKRNEKCLDKDTGKFSLNGVWGGDCYEQGVMNKLLNGKYSKYMYQIPESFCVNSYKPITKSVILHMFGNKNKALETFKKYI